MPSAEHRQIGITRPRQSLSCVVCRRRKVRCGREQPACSNCIRTKVVCEYESDPADWASRHIKRKQTGSASRAKAAPSPPAISEEPSSSWAAQQRHPPPSQSFNIEPGIETDESSRHHTARHRSASASTSVVSRSQPPTDVNNPFIPSTRPQRVSLPSDNLPIWDTSPREDDGHPLQLVTPSLTASTAGDSGSLPLPKRRRTAESFASANGQDAVLEDPTRRQKGAGASADFAASHLGELSPRPIGYLSVQKGGCIRYVGGAFWGLIKGHESLCETFLVEKYDVPDNVPLPYINSLGLAELLTTLPNKVVCDALFQSFSISVHPIHPLIHLPTIQTDYNNFWQWCRNSDISLPDNKLLGDPTFLCLLLSILCCGATVAPLAAWTAGSLQHMEKDKIVEQLKKMCSTSLGMCQHLQHPTFFTLVSSLLTHSCSKPDATHLEDLNFVSKILRVAQNMGLHRDGSSFGLDTITSELRRRVWWHIAWLDMQASILHGSLSCCSSNEVGSDVKMVSGTRDEDLSMMANGFGTRGPSPSSSATSTAMLLAIGRFESTRFKRFLASNLSSARDPGQAQFDNIVSAAKSLQTKLDRMIARIPTQGIAETGFIPSRLATASPLTHEWLYSDRIDQATIWNSWAKNMLIMLKTEVAISVQQPLLARADSKSKQQQRLWNSVVQLCITHLRNFVQLVRTPAFAPYSWFCKISQIPLQPVFIILTYLQYNKGCVSEGLGRHFVDEVIDIFNFSDDRPFTHGEDRHNPAASRVTSFNKQIPLHWQMLVKLRSKLDDSPNAERSRFEPVAPIRCQLVPPAIALRTMSLSTSEKSSSSPNIAPGSHSQEAPPAANATMPPPTDPPVVNGQVDIRGGDSQVENALDLSDFEAWCSSITQDPTAYHPGGQNAEESVDGAPISNVEFDAEPAGLGDMFDYFGD